MLDDPTVRVTPELIPVALSAVIPAGVVFTVNVTGVLTLFRAVALKQISP